MENSGNSAPVLRQLRHRALVYSLCRIRTTMLAALFRMHFPISAQGQLGPASPRLAPSHPELEQLKQDELR
jgi:hypothetical protein